MGGPKYIVKSHLIVHGILVHVPSDFDAIPVVIGERRLNCSHFQIEGSPPAPSAPQ
jgi:hypothetical protein